MSYPEDAGIIADLTDGEDFQEADNVNIVKDELQNVKTFLGTPGAAQSHLATLLDMLADNYVGWRVYKKDADEIYIGAGAGIISNAAGSVRKLRKSTSVTTLSAADLDTGAFAANTAYCVYATADGVSTAPVFVISASFSAPTGYTHYRKIGWFYNETISVLDITKGQISSFSGGGNVNHLNFQTGELATGTTILPIDDTIPQNTEGDEYMTLTIVPTSATNKLKIDVVVFYGEGSDASNAAGAALFQDATADALACGFSQELHSAALWVCGPISFTYFMTAGTTSPTTFKVRAGMDAAGTFNFNGAGGARKGGGVMASSITITEIP